MEGFVLGEVRIRNVNDDKIEHLKQLAKENGYETINDFMLSVVENLTKGLSLPKSQFRETISEIHESKNEILASNQLIIKALESNMDLIKLLVEDNDDE